MTKAQEENKKVIERLHEAIGDMDWKKVEELLADDALMGQPGQPRTQGSKQIVEGLVQTIEIEYKVTALRPEILDLGVVGPYVIDDRIDWGTIGDKEYGTHVAGSYLVENGKILDWTEWVSSEILNGSS
jgi:limonene-1,2-epoxide hydrolase